MKPSRSNHLLGNLPLALLTLAITTLAAAAPGQSPGSLDLTFDPTVHASPVGLTGGSPVVQAVLPQPDGKVLIAGSFSGVNGLRRNYLARLNANGQVDATFRTGLGPDGSVEELALQADGRILIAGSFRTVDTRPHSLIARLNPDGSLDESFQCQVTGYLNLKVNGVAEMSDGKIWIGGIFTNVNGVARQNIARLNADGSVDTSLDPGQIWPGSNNYVYQLVRQADGKLLVAGVWSNPTRSVLRLNQDGTLDTGFASVVALESVEFYTPGQIRDMACNEEGTIAIAGVFAAVNGEARRYVARLYPDGRLDTRFNAAPGPDYNFLWTVAVQPDNKLIVGGNFGSFNATTRMGIARLNGDGSVDQGFDPGDAAGVADQYHASIRAITLQPDGHVLVAASAWWEASTTNAVFRLSPTGQREPGFSPFLQASIDGIAHMALQPDGKIIVAQSYGSTVLRLEPNGGIDPTFVPEVSFAGVFAMTLQPDGKLLVASYAEPGVELTRLWPDGSLDTTFQSPTIQGGEAPVEVITVQPDGKILVGGLIWLVDNEPRTGVIRLHPDGSLDSDFQTVPISVTDDPGYGVEYIWVLPSGDILIAGGFGWAHGGEGGLARLGPDGTVDQDFADRVGGFPYVYSAARQIDGKILIGSFVTEIGAGLYRINPDGSRDESFRIELLGEYGDLAPQPDERILAVHRDFQNYPPESRVVRLNSNGSVDPEFQATFYQYPAGPSRILLQPDGQVLVCGGFQSVSGYPMDAIARLNNDVRSRVDVAPRPAGAPFRITVSALPGVRLAIEASSDLVSWKTVEEVVMGSVPITVSDPASGLTSQRFYRAREQ